MRKMRIADCGLRNDSPHPFPPRKGEGRGGGNSELQTPNPNFDNIVVTGIGIISACGIGKEAFWKNCLEGRSGIAPIQSFETSAYRSTSEPKPGTSTQGLHALFEIPPDEPGFPAGGCRQHRSHKGRSSDGIPSIGPSIGVVLGTGYGSTAQTDEFFVGMLKEGPEGANPSLFPDTVPNAPASQVSIYHGLQGPNTTFSHNEVSGNRPWPMLSPPPGKPRAGDPGGSVDEMSFVLFHSFSALRALSPGDKQEEGMRPLIGRGTGAF